MNPCFQCLLQCGLNEEIKGYFTAWDLQSDYLKNSRRRSSKVMFKSRDQYATSRSVRSWLESITNYLTYVSEWDILCDTLLKRPSVGSAVETKFLTDRSQIGFFRLPHPFLWTPIITTTKYNTIPLFRWCRPLDILLYPYNGKIKNRRNVHHLDCLLSRICFVYFELESSVHDQHWWQYTAIVAHRDLESRNNPKNQQDGLVYPLQENNLEKYPYIL